MFHSSKSSSTELDSDGAGVCPNAIERTGENDSGLTAVLELAPVKEAKEPTTFSQSIFGDV